MRRESWPHPVYGHTGGGRAHTVDTHQLGMGVNDQQEHLSYERFRIIYVHSRPRAARHSHVCNGKQGWVFWWLWQVAKLFTFSNKLVSVFGPLHSSWINSSFWLLFGVLWPELPIRGSQACTLNSSLLIERASWLLFLPLKAILEE